MENLATTQKFCFLLIAIAIGNFYFIYYYNWYLEETALLLAEPVAKLTSLFSTKQPPQTPVFVPGGRSITERYSIFLMLILSIGVLLVSASLATIHRIKFGASRFFVPLIICCIVGIGTVIVVAYDMGLGQYA